MPLLRSLAGPDFPLSHTRRYIARTSSTDKPGESKHPATVLVGTQADFEYDAIAELVFDDETGFLTFSAKMAEKEAAEQIAKDEEAFLDRARMTAVVLDSCAATGRI